jgi:hypothetical protein
LRSPFEATATPALEELIGVPSLLLAVDEHVDGEPSFLEAINPPPPDWGQWHAVAASH